MWEWWSELNTLRPRPNGQHFAYDIFKCIFFNENVWIWIKISPMFVPKGQISKIRALLQIMAWCRPGGKPLSEPIIIRLSTHICVTRSTMNWYIRTWTKWPPFFRGHFPMDVGERPISKFWLKFHWSLFLMVLLKISHRWFRKLFATSSL